MPYYLYLVPVTNNRHRSRDAASHGFVENGLVIGAVLEKREYRLRSRSLEGLNQFALGVIPLVIIVAGWPLLKLQFMRSTERVARRTGVWLVYSMLCTLMLLMFLILHSELERPDDIDNRLKLLADKVSENVNRELQDIIKSIQSVHTSRVFLEARPRPAPNLPCQTNMDTGPFTPVSRPRILAQDSPLYFWYPFLDQLIWTDALGYQRIKWSVRSQPTPEVCMDSFPFFRDAALDHYWHFRRVAKNPQTAVISSKRFRVDPLYSPNTGEYLAVVSQPLLAEHSHEGALQMVSMTTPFISLIDAVVPPGTGFAVVQANGLVLFHSVSARNQRQNLVNEVTDPGALRSAIDVGSGSFLETSYLGIPHRFYVTRFSDLEDCPWSLIVFQDLSYAEASHVEVMILYAAMLVMYLFIWLIVALVWWACLPQYPPKWVWPTAANAKLYRRLSIPAVVAFVASWLLWTFSAGHLETLSYIILLPMSAITYVGFSLYMGRERVRQKSWIIGLATVSCVALLVMLVNPRPALHEPARRLLILSLVLSLWRLWLWLDDLRVLIPLREHLLRSKRVQKVVSWCSTRTRSMPELEWFGPYVVFVTLLLLLTAILPSIALCRLAYEFETAAFAGESQLLTWRALQQRLEKVEGRFRTVCLPPATDPMFSRHDLAPIDPSRTCESKSSDSVTKWLLLRHRLDSQYDRYDLPDSKFEMGRQRRDLTAVPNVGVTLVGFTREAENWLQDSVAFIAGFLPYPRSWMISRASEDVGAAHLIGFQIRPRIRTSPGGNKAGSWVWEWESPTMLRMTLVSGDSRSLGAWRGFPEHDLMMPEKEILTFIPEFPGLHRPSLLWIILLCFGVYFWLYRTMDRLFVLQAGLWQPWPSVQTDRLQHCSGQRRNAILLGYPNSNETAFIPKLEPGSFSYFDMCSLDDESLESIPDRAKSARDLSEPCIVIDHFSHRIDDGEHNSKKVALLNGLLFQTDKSVVLISAVDPFFYLLDGGEDVPTSEVDNAHQQQWAKILSEFEDVGWLDETGSGRSAGKIAPELPSRSSAYYRLIWQTRTQRERLALVQLARDGWVNWKNRKAVEHLVRWNLVSADPVVQIADSSFAFYVDKLGNSPEVINLQGAEDKNVWDALKVFGLVLATGLFALILSSEQVNIAVALAFLTTVISLLSSIFKIGSLFNNPIAMGHSESGSTDVRIDR